ncbi:MAG TPA: bifunctional DNA-formamidopyrimidine glycosylase/DNA-(apurinic or apyrimidinic site) lyase [Pyrinomonadaceae bacterium]|nr:bifunctional DNA-formamidopyrimidine glycosylase/DNA-(apurinic or apyrimidinic site) lyase [Pyrinomonadaceae bacterium]
MPELPEVEHVVRALRRVIVGRTIVASEVRLAKLVAPLSVAAFNRRIKRATLTGVSRRGKFILIELDRKADTSRRSAGIRPAKRAQRSILAVHLRMTGKFVLLNPDDPLPKHGHAIFYLDKDQRLVFRDQRQFAVMKLIDSADLSQTKGISELAPEPFGEEFTVEYLRSLLKRSQRSLKTLLLDQTKVLGLGNIYAAEALFRARINPFKPAAELSARRVPALYEAIREVLQFAVDHIRGSISLEEGFSYGAAFENFWQVYEREGEPCVRCGTKIRRATHGGRSTYWCPKCQRR